LELLATCVKPLLAGELAIKILTAILFLTLSVPVFADRQALPTPLIFVDALNTTYLKLTPGKNLTAPEVGASGTAYEIRAGKDRPIYTVSGWYSRAVLLSPHGEYLVRLGPWPVVGQRPDETIAIVFYDAGKLIRQYFITDLVEPTDKLPRSVSHYRWGDDLRWADGPFSGHVAVTTAAGRVILFDIATGSKL
jgi:hypothetical protein